MQRQHIVRHAEKEILMIMVFVDTEKRTLRPFARLIARNGRSTRSTRRIFTTDIARSLITIDINETATTTISRILKRFRQNAPG